MQSILDALLAQYVTPYQGGGQPMQSPMPGQPGQPQMSPAPQPGGQPQQPMQQDPQAQMAPQPDPLGGGAQQAPQPPPLADVEQALKSGLDTEENQALVAFEEGAAPFEKKWQDATTQRFRGGVVGFGEQLYDMYREKKLGGQRQAVDSARSKLTQDAKLELADQKYKDAKTLLSEKYPNASKDEIDALSRRYAQGEDIDIEPEVMKQLTAAEMAEIQRQEEAHRLGMTKDQLALADTIYDDAKADIGSFNKSQRTIQNINLTAEKGWKGQGAGQVLALYNMIKILDPDSVVREGEVRLAQMGESLMNRFLAKYEGVSENTVMSEEMFNDVVTLSQELAALAQESYQTVFQDHVSRASEYGMTGEQVFGGNLMNRITTGAIDPAPIEKSSKEDDEPSERASDIARREREAEEGGLTRISTAEEYNALPPGTRYIDPNGVTRTKGSG